MAHRVVRVPAFVLEAIYDLQHRTLAHEIESDQLRLEVEKLLGPYLHELPGPNDLTDIELDPITRVWAS